MVNLEDILRLKDEFDNTFLVNVHYKWHHFLEDDIKNNTYYNYLWAITKLINPRSYLEIGTLFGYSFMAIVSAMQNPKRALSLDAELYCRRSQTTARLNFEKAGLDAKGVEWRVVDTQQPISLKESFDLVFVDGDHSFEGAYKDLCSAWSRLNDDGYLLVDDTTYIPHVKKAVSKFITDMGISDHLHLPMVVRGLDILKKTSKI